jgi:tRNA dimethylallyltransferase
MATSLQLQQKPLIVIAGPTASGKSAVAVLLANMLTGDVINADATQVYRDLQVLSARPSDEEMTAAPHHLFGVRDGAQACSTAQWRDMAVMAVENVWARKRVPIVVGGTGLYLRTLLEGIAEVPEIDSDMRQTVREMDTDTLAAALQAEDPAMASLIHAADRQRQARALEVIRSTGTSLRIWQSRMSGGLAARADVGPILRLVVLPERAALYVRCDARLVGMMAAGALAEVQALMDRQLDPALPVMKAVGVPELSDYLAGSTTLAEAVARAQQSTRRYAKRQYTWMRNQFADWHRLTSSELSSPQEELAILLLKYGLTLK